MPDALMLLSGGLDSLTALAWVVSEGYAILGALSFDYGQRHARESVRSSRLVSSTRSPTPPPSTGRAVRATVGPKPALLCGGALCLSAPSA